MIFTSLLVFHMHSRKASFLAVIRLSILEYKKENLTIGNIFNNIFLLFLKRIYFDGCELDQDLQHEQQHC